MSTIPIIQSDVSGRAILRAMHYFDENERVEICAEAIKNVDIEKYNQMINCWKKADKQYYILSKGKESFFVPPNAVTEFDTNIFRAIEFEWYKLKEKYANYTPPTTE